MCVWSVRQRERKNELHHEELSLSIICPVNCCLTATVAVPARKNIVHCPLSIVTKKTDFVLPKESTPLFCKSSVVISSKSQSNMDSICLLCYFLHTTEFHFPEAQKLLILLWSPVIHFQVSRKQVFRLWDIQNSFWNVGNYMFCSESTNDIQYRSMRNQSLLRIRQILMSSGSGHYELPCFCCHPQ